MVPNGLNPLKPVQYASADAFLPALGSGDEGSEKGRAKKYSPSSSQSQV